MTGEENARLSIDEYRRGAELLDSLPRVVYVEVTNTCNLACPMCPISMGIKSFIGRRKLFPWELLEKLRPMLDTAVRCVMSAGGEPFLHPRFIDMIRFVKKAGAQVIFNTNATLMDENAAKMMVDLQTDTISFSVDAADPTVYSSIRLGADLETVKGNIKRLVNIKQKAGSQRPFLNLQMTLMRSNFDEMIPVVEAAADWGIRHVVVEPLSPVFSEDSRYAEFVAANGVGVDEALPVIRETLGRARELGMIFTSHYLVMGGDEPQPDLNLKCVQPWINFGVRADGMIFPCCGTSHTLGDLQTMQPLDAWNSKEYRELRRAIAKGVAPDFCKLCLQEGRAMFFNADLVQEET